MRTLIAAAVIAGMTMQLAGPALARDFFNRTTMLGWRQQTGAAVVAYVRAPLGPTSLKAPVRSGLAITGPRPYSAGDTPRYSQGPRLVDFAFTRRGIDARWIGQLAVGHAVAWTNDPHGVAPDQVNLMESGVSWIAVGAITVGLAAGTLGLIEKEEP